MSDIPASGSDVFDLEPERIPVSQSATSASIGNGYTLQPYDPQKQYDFVRTTVTIGLLAVFAFVIVWVVLKSSSSKDVWSQTKDMLQIVLPALMALFGSVLGFYFGIQKIHSLGR